MSKGNWWDGLSKIERKRLIVKCGIWSADSELIEFDAGRKWSDLLPSTQYQLEREGVADEQPAANI